MSNAFPLRSGTEQAVVSSSEPEDIAFWLKDSLGSDNVNERITALNQIASYGATGAAVLGFAGDVIGSLDDPDETVQAAALIALGSMGSFGAAYCPRVIEKLGSENKRVRIAAVQAMGGFGPGGAEFASDVEPLLESDDLDLVKEACFTLGAMKAQEYSPRIAAKIGGDVEVSIGAIAGLSRLGSEVDAVGKALTHEEARVRAFAANSLCDFEASDKFAPEIGKLVGDSDCWVRIGAVKAALALTEKLASEADVIAEFLSSDTVGVKTAACLALGAIGERADSKISVVEKLLQDTSEDRSPAVLYKAGVVQQASAAERKPACAAAFALGKFGAKAKSCAASLADGLKSPDWEVRVACINALSETGAIANFEAKIVELLDDPAPQVVAAASLGLGRLAELSAPSVENAVRVAEMLYEKHPVVRSAAVTALGKMGEEAIEHIEELVRSLDDPIWSVQLAAIGALTNLNEVGQMYAKDVAGLMFSQDARVRVAAIQAMPKFGKRGAGFADEVVMCMSESSPEIRIAALRALQEFPTASEYKYEVENVLDLESFPEVKLVAKSVLASITLGAVHGLDLEDME